MKLNLIRLLAWFYLVTCFFSEDQINDYFITNDDKKFHDGHCLYEEYVSVLNKLENNLQTIKSKFLVSCVENFCGIVELCAMELANLCLLYNSKAMVGADNPCFSNT